MRFLIVAILFIIVLAGCQTLKKAANDVEPGKKQKSLVIKLEGESLRNGGRDWRIEIGADNKRDAQLSGDGPAIEEYVPDAFIFPRNIEDVATAMPLIKHEGGLIDFTFNFKDADIKEVIHQLLGKILGLNYIIDKKVTGVINLNTSGEIYKDELLTIVQTMLDINGYTIAKDGEIYKILPVQDVRQLPGKVITGDKVIKSGKDIITQIVPLKYIAPQGIIPTLRTFLTKGGTAVSPNDTHVIIVVDDASNIERLLTIIKTFDAPFFAGRAIKFFDIKHLNVKNLAKHLRSIAGSLGASTKGKKANLAFLPFVEATKLLVTTKAPELFDTVELWIKNLDILPKEGERVRTYIYKMQHNLAEQVAPILNEVFKKEIEAIKKSPPSIAKKELKIIAYAGTNSIIIRATESDYFRIRGIIDEMDSTPLQVLIEVLIAEVKLNENLQYGVQYFIRDRFPENVDGGVTSEDRQRETVVRLNPVAPESASLSFLTESIGFNLLFSAIAGESSFEFLANPHILVKDGQTATIQVGEDTPIIGGTTLVGETVTENVQYRAVGINLAVTPLVGENGMVTIDITLEDSNVGGAGVRGNPIFITRRTETSIVVKDGHTILISGIIESRDNVNITKIPLVGDIPLVGNLFKSREITKSRTEHLVLLTPHIIYNSPEADRLTKSFEAKLNAVALLKRGGTL
ncbi:MAG: type II secretion system secretin GspD [Candidatus Anammoxibacter sp.]